MTGEILGIINNITGIGANTITIIIGLMGLVGAISYFSSKKQKIIRVFSSRFGVLVEDGDIKQAVFPKRISDEIYDLKYEGDDPKEFINNDFIKELNKIKSQFSVIGIFGIAEMFIFFSIGYILQNTIKIEGYRRLKDDLSFSGTPRGWTGFFSLKWGLGIKNLVKNLLPPYKISGLDRITGKKEICLKIQISSIIQDNLFPNNLNSLPSVQLSLKKINGSFLINHGQIKGFYKKLEKVIKKIENEVGLDGKIHLFISTPVPFCIKLGQSIHRNGPEYILYDFSRNENKYYEVISTKDFRL